MFDSVFNSEEESSFADLIAVCPVFEMADWTYCEDEFLFAEVAGFSCFTAQCHDLGKT